MPHRLPWLAAQVEELRTQTPSAHSLLLKVPGWPGHLAGQHLDVRLRSQDGYTAQRSYSIADVEDGDRVELTVQRVVDGEVSGYLVDVVRPGDQFEVRGPIGGYFVWRPAQRAPLLLVAGGSGVVPLRAMLRARRRAAAAGGPVPAATLVYAVRDRESVLYRDELELLAADDVRLHFVYSRAVPPGWPEPPGHLHRGTLDALGPPAAQSPDVYLCGPTGFVETVANLLVQAGHSPAAVRTERFGQ